MLSRANGLRHAARAARTLPTRPTIAVQRSSPIARHITLLPWRRKPAAPVAELPVYFPRSKPSSPWRHPWRQPARGFIFGRIRRITFAVILICGCYEIFMTLVWDPFLDWGDAEWETLSEKERQEIIEAEEDDAPLIFLPFPFTTKSVPQPPYKGSDPEWASFVAVNRDKKVQEEIRRELTEIVRRGVEKHPLFSRLLGSKTIQITRRWLEIIYPQRPPPKHYISGVFLDDSGVGWTDRPIDALAVEYLDNAIRPTAVALGAWTWTSIILGNMVADVRWLFGFGAEAPPATTWHSAGMPGPLKDIHGGANASSSPPVKASIQGPVWVPQHSPQGEESALWEFEKRMAENGQTALTGALLAFSKNWKPIKRPPTRGCLRVDGLVELKGEKAHMAVWVLGWYDPKAKKFMGIETKLKHLIQHKQTPASG